MHESIHRDPDVYAESPYLTPQEVESLLQRLSAKTERTSVHDVAEATGLTPEQVQLIVAEMRRAEAEVLRQRQEIDELREEQARLKSELSPKKRDSHIHVGGGFSGIAFVLIICLTIIALNYINAMRATGNMGMGAAMQGGVQTAAPAPPPLDTGVAAPTDVVVGSPR